jgi:superfamily I DNA and/or RNA helicase
LLNSIPKGSLLDYVIIDEASQVDLVTAVLVMSCCKNLIVVGDTNQLSHITN